VIGAALRDEGEAKDDDGDDDDVEESEGQAPERRREQKREEQQRVRSLTQSGQQADLFTVCVM
jgi:hypothetical protein